MLKISILRKFNKAEKEKKIQISETTNKLHKNKAAL